MHFESRNETPYFTHTHTHTRARARDVYNTYIFIDVNEIRIMFCIKYSH